eukprot:TRINITY_DN850_c0_g1_i4.p1 TRINITY_DN850_c0_g1~~TRINITY_DN850_c0_g1_i4.p1  ORF type:complete len:261 (-),score=29.69 TRINITY_DN850_c0_g1_i4:1727-2509(-)
MEFHTLCKFISKFLPFFSGISIAFVVCYNRIKDRYVGHMQWPYISETGRSHEEWWIFTITMTISAISLATLMWGWAMMIRKFKHFRLTVLFASICGGITAPWGMITLAAFDVSKHNKLHIFAALVFFVSAIIVQSFHLKFTQTVIKRGAAFPVAFKTHLPEIKKYQKWKIGVFCCTVICAGFYGPFLQPFSCTPYKGTDGNVNYEECPEIHSVRAVFQMCTVLSLLIYFQFLRFDFEFFKNKSKILEVELSALNAAQQRV